MGRRPPSLAEYYRGGLRLEAEPGTMGRYAITGSRRWARSSRMSVGCPLNRYLREHVFEPLGMATPTSSDPRWSGPGSPRGTSSAPAGPKAVADREIVTAGAGGVYSTPSDMARYVIGAPRRRRQRARHRPQAGDACPDVRPHFQPDPRIPGMGMGFLRRVGGHSVVEHEGICWIPPGHGRSRRGDRAVSRSPTPDGSTRGARRCPSECETAPSPPRPPGDDVRRTMSRNTRRSGVTCAAGTPWSRRAHRPPA